MSELEANLELFMQHLPAFRAQFPIPLDDESFVKNFNTVGLAVQDRLRRLFPEEDPTDLARVKPYWVDLPVHLLRPGELNLLHYPSIFDDDSIFTSYSRVLEKLVEPFILQSVRQWFVNDGIPEARMDDFMVETAAASLIWRDTHKHDTALSETNVLDRPDCYPRSLFASPQRNAGVLFRPFGSSPLEELFSTAAAGRTYFYQELVRVPATLSRGGFPTILDVRPLVNDASGINSSFLFWNHLPSGEPYVWCRTTLADHSNCPPYACMPKWDDVPPARRGSSGLSRRDSASSSNGLSRRDSAYSLGSNIDGPPTPLPSPSPVRRGPSYGSNALTRRDSARSFVSTTHGPPTPEQSYSLARRSSTYSSSRLSRRDSARSFVSATDVPLTPSEASSPAQHSPILGYM